MGATFAGIEKEYTVFETARILLQSIPYDGTSTWGKGADRGFKAFMQAAENMELFDIETASEVFRQGIHVLPPLQSGPEPDRSFETIYHHTKELLHHNKFLTCFGGEHSISIGIIKAFYEHFDNLTVLQIDAHADLRQSYNGSPYNHACALYDASQNTNLIQVGIRSMDKSEGAVMDIDRCYFMHQIYSSKSWMDHSLEQMTAQVYITLDLDAFDPSIMPSTGTPEPGGFDWYSMLEYLRKVFNERDVVGFDIVELAPIPEMPGPDFLAAKLYYKMLSYKFENAK